MLKTVAAIIGLVLLLSVSATVGNATTSTNNVEEIGDEDSPFHCRDEGPPVGRICSCETDEGCDDLFETNNCSGDLTCRELDSSTDYCICDWQSRLRRMGRRSERLDQADENAPISDDIVGPSNRVNETVGARRGTAPVQEGASEGQEEEEDAPTRRDHRR